MELWQREIWLANAILLSKSFFSFNNNPLSCNGTLQAWPDSLNPQISSGFADFIFHANSNWSGIADWNNLEDSLGSEGKSALIS